MRAESEPLTAGGSGASPRSPLPSPPSVIAVHPAPSPVTGAEAPSSPVRSRGTRFLHALVGAPGSFARQRTMSVGLSTFALSLGFLLIIALTAAAPQAEGNSLSFIPILFAALLALSVMMQVLRLCRGAWAASARTQRWPPDGIPAHVAEAHLAFALTRVRASAGVTGGALDAHITGQLRAAGLDDATIGRITNMMREGAVVEAAEGYQALLALDGDTVVVVGPGRRSRTRGRPVNPRALRAAEVDRFPTFIHHRSKAALEAEAAATLPGAVAEEGGDAAAEDARRIGGLWCAVCLSNVEEGSTVRMLPCMHAFDRECIDSWFTRANTCPVCKVSMRDPMWSAGAGEEDGGGPPP